jgi:hypothetical protein
MGHYTQLVHLFPNQLLGDSNLNTKRTKSLSEAWGNSSYTNMQLFINAHNYILNINSFFCHLSFLKAETPIREQLK